MTGWSTRTGGGGLLSKPPLLLPLLLLCASLLLLSVLVVDAQMIRIPLKRHDLPPDSHPTRSAKLLSRQLAAHSASPGVHHRTLNLVTDPSRPVSLRNYFNRMYTGMVSIGTPGHEYSLVFDTGSADLWVFSAKAQSTQLDFVKYYDHTISSTAKTTTTPWSIQYGKGSASGVLASDAVAVAGLSASDVTFATATQWSDDFETEIMPLDGLLGLAFSKVSSANAATLVDELKRQGKITDRVFSFYLTDNGREGSQFILGQPDLSLTGGQEITYLDLASSSGMWLLSMQGVTLGNTQTNWCGGSDCAVLVDTGTSFVGMPTSTFNDFARRIQRARPDCAIDSGSGLILCQSPSTSGLPDISFSLQGHFFTLTGAQYYDAAQRVIGMMAIDVGSNGEFWILGDTFLKTYYTVYDMDNSRIGITGAKPGLPYSPPEDESPFRRASWQLILIILAGVLLLVLVGACVVKGCTHKRQQRRTPGTYASPPGGVAAPYVLQGAPPFQSQPHRMQPTRGQPTRGQPPRGQPRSEFARDFYAQPV